MTNVIYKKIIVDNPSGDILNIEKDANVSVFVADTSNLAQIYTDRLGGTLKANPFSASDGVAEFYVAAGRYDVVASIGGEEVFRDSDVLLAEERATDIASAVALQFATVADMIASNSQNAAAIDFADYVGRKVSTVYNNNTSKAGGADYVVKTLVQAAADGDVIDGTGAPNYIGGNHALSDGVHVAILNANELNISMFGVCNGVETNYSQAIELALAFGPINIDIVCNCEGVDVPDGAIAYGVGSIRGINPSTPNDILVNFGACNNVEWSVTIDANQSGSTIPSDNKYRYSTYGMDCIDLTMKDFDIINSKIGFPIYFSGTSSNGINADLNGVKNLKISNVTVDGLEPSVQSTGTADTNEIVIASQVYGPDGGGIYFGSSNGVKTSDFDVDSSVTYPATTENVKMDDCHFKNCGRVTLFNIKNSKFSRNKLDNFGYRGWNLGPTCHNIKINGGNVYGGYGAALNASYCCTEIYFNGIYVDPQIFGATATADDTAIRCLYGSNSVHFNAITGRSGRLRGAWILGVRDVTLDRVILDSYLDGTYSTTDAGLSISAGLGGNTSSHIMSGIRVTNSYFECIDGIEFNEFTGTATYENDGIEISNTLFLNSGDAVDSAFTGSPSIDQKIKIKNVEFASGSTTGFVRNRLSLDLSNIWGDYGTSTFYKRYFDTTSTPDDCPVGMTFCIVNGDDSAPGAGNQGTLVTFKEGDGGLRRWSYQLYYPATTPGDSAAAGFYIRHARNTTNTWNSWAFK